VEAHIEEPLYRRIVESLPIVCVDLLARKDNDYLLVKRTNEPLKGEWWVPGGRILKDEPVLEAVKRKLWSETGLVMLHPRFVGFYEDAYPTSHYGVPCHAISLLYEGIVAGKITLNHEAEEYKWTPELPQRLTRRWAYPELKIISEISRRLGFS
jgi:colanic acid biosynthesis protein WcaH